MTRHEIESLRQGKKRLAAQLERVAKLAAK